MAPLTQLDKTEQRTYDRSNRTNPLRVVLDVADVAIFMLICVSAPKFVLDGSPLAPVAAPAARTRPPPRSARASFPA
jgi:hypothetical protein